MLARNISDTIQAKDFIDEKKSAKMRELGAEGIVLLENDGVLPLKKDNVISVFGRTVIDYYYIGFGSGGDLLSPYRITPLEALEAHNDIKLYEPLPKFYTEFCNSKEGERDFGGWGGWVGHFAEPEMSDEMVEEAAKNSDVAVVFIGRNFGEQKEGELRPGNYYLAASEIKMLQQVNKNFEKIVLVINSGNIMDMDFLKKYHFSAVMCAWQGGQESGNQIVDILTGEVNPSGKLSDTIALCYGDYITAKNFGGMRQNIYYEDIFVGYRYFETFAKEKVMYPFGYGLSYTQFAFSDMHAEKNDDDIHVTFAITNTGETSGKEVGQVYVCCPNGKMMKPKRQLVGFKKTKELAPNETQKFEVSFCEYDIASYDDTGKTGHKACYVLEAGTYKVYVGNDVRKAEKIGEFQIEELKVLQQLNNRLKSQFPIVRLTYTEDENGIKTVDEIIPLEEYDLRDRILANLPTEIKQNDKTYHFNQVLDGGITMDEFIASLSFGELEGLIKGEGMVNSKFGTPQNTGTFGGSTKELREKGVTPITTTDGPSGIRGEVYTTLLPSAIQTSCTWNIELVKEAFQYIGDEMNTYGVDVILTPGMNIHRDPLCGRNFEYFSEDPYLSGEMACGVVEGIESVGFGTSVKHFACNNQENQRKDQDAICSERALREIYLKGFERCVKKTNPKTVMTSYNKINGVWNTYNYDLVQAVLRDEWKYEGVVVTDWWPGEGVISPEFPELRHNGYRVRASVDMLMPGEPYNQDGTLATDGTLWETYGQEDGITLGEVQASARRVLNMVYMKEKHK